MDEFANISLPDDFDKILSVMRSRGVSVSIIIQNLAQLKALFEKQWESIVGNCDEFLYLGGNEQSTHKYVSELLGKETIDTNTYGKSRGRNGSYSTNYQISGRELMTPDEVRMLDNKYAILFIEEKDQYLTSSMIFSNILNFNLQKMAEQSHIYTTRSIKTLHQFHSSIFLLMILKNTHYLIPITTNFYRKKNYRKNLTFNGGIILNL